jgi:hypothetical protein
MSDISACFSASQTVLKIKTPSILLAGPNPVNPISHRCRNERQHQRTGPHDNPAFSPPVFFKPFRRNWQGTL